MITSAREHRELCGRDGEFCPTGEHGYCPGCHFAAETLVTAPIDEHDAGCPVITPIQAEMDRLHTDALGESRRRGLAGAARYTVVSFEAEIAEGGGTKYMVVDAEKGGLGGGGVVYHNGGHLFTRELGTAEGWAATLNQAGRLQAGSC